MASMVAEAGETFETNNVAEEPVIEQTEKYNESIEQNQQTLVHDAEQGAGADGGEKRWPGWPGDSVFRILVPVQKVGGIIGRKGEYIKRMCEESRARIKVLDGPPGAPERAVMISAKEEQDASISPAMDGLLRVHRRSVGLEGELSNGSLNAGIAIRTRLLVAASQAGSLIGKQGATIKSIQEASGCVVRIVEELPVLALPDDRVVEIQGEATGAHKAVELIAGQLRKFLVDRSVLPLFETHLSMSNARMKQNAPPPQSWGHPQGLTSNAGGAGFVGHPQFMPTHPPHDNFYPTPELPPIEKQPHHGVSSYGREPPHVGGHSATTNQSQAVISQITQHMQIPLSYADAVIGTAGANISYIRRASGATITIQESRGAPGEMTVEINGSATQVQTAQQLIQNFMAEATAPPQNTAPADQGYNSYQSQGSNMYMSTSGNSGPTGHSSSGGYGYGSTYGTSYGY